MELSGIVQKIYSAKNDLYSCLHVWDRDIKKVFFVPIRNDRIKALGIKEGYNIQDVFTLRLHSKDKDRIVNLLEISNKKLENPNFLLKAPEEIVKKEREKNEDLKNKLKLC